MEGGYILIDAKGMDIKSLPVTIPGYYNRLTEAYLSGKPVIFTNYKYSGVPVSPLAAALLKVLNSIVVYGSMRFVVSADDVVSEFVES